MKKKIISLVLAVVMITALVPTAMAASVVDSGTCGDNLTWTLDSDGTLTISGEGKMRNWTYSSGSPWHSSRSSIKAVNIENSVTSVGEYAFSGCDSLTSVTIPDSVTSIGRRAFGYCISLVSIIVSASNEAYKDIDGVLFDKTGETLIQYPIGKEAVSYTVPDSVTNIRDYAFSDCTSLTSVTIPDSVIWILDCAFRNCTGLTKINIPYNAIIMGTPFVGCSNLEYISVDENHTAYKDIDGILFSKDGAYLLTYPAGRKESSYVISKNVTRILDYAFYGCENLKEISYEGSKINWRSIDIGEGNDILCEPSMPGAEYSASGPVTIELTVGSNIIYINDELIEIDAAPVLKNNRTMVPIRIIAEALGAKVTWTTYSLKDAVLIEPQESAYRYYIIIGETGIVVYTNPFSEYFDPNHEVNKELDTPAFIMDGRAYLPLRFVSESIGAEVEWDAENQKVTISKD